MISLDSSCRKKLMRNLQDLVWPQIRDSHQKVSPHIQAKLKFTNSADSLEQEANTIADRISKNKVLAKPISVMEMTDTVGAKRNKRKCSGCQVKDQEIM